MVTMVNKMMVIDVKYQNLNDNMDFILDVNEIIKHLELEVFLIELHRGVYDKPDYVNIKFFCKIITTSWQSICRNILNENS